MDTARTIIEDQQPEKQEAEQKIDLKAKIKEFMKQLPSDQRHALEECKWEDTHEKWEEGLLEFLEKDVERSGKVRLWVLRDYLKGLENSYNNTSQSKDPEHKKLLKAQLAVVKKIFGLFTNEKESKTSKEKNANENVKNLYSWENIKLIMRKARRQIFELAGVKDPWWDYSQDQKGMQTLEQQAVPKAAVDKVVPASVQAPAAHSEKSADVPKAIPHEEQKAA